MLGRFCIFIISLVSITLPLRAQDQIIPSCTAETLTDKKVTLPNDVRGHISVFVVGFSRKSKDPANAWSKRLQEEFAGNPNVAVYEVAHLQGAPRLLRGMIVSGMRKGVPPEQEERFLVVTEKEDEWKRWANFTEPDNAYVLILNKSAEATWRTHESLNDKILEYTKAEVLTLNAH
jgi:hypothetical protein